MAIYIECDDCFLEYEIEDKYEKEKLSCKECGSSVSIVKRKSGLPKVSNEAPTKPVYDEPAIPERKGYSLTILIPLIVILVLDGTFLMFAAKKKESVFYKQLLEHQKVANNYAQAKQFANAIIEYQKITSLIDKYENPANNMLVIRKESHNSIAQCTKEKKNRIIAAEKIKLEQDLIKSANRVQSLVESKEYLQAIKNYKLLLKQAKNFKNLADPPKKIIAQTKEAVGNGFQIWVTEQEKLINELVSKGHVEMALSVQKIIQKNSMIVGARFKKIVDVEEIEQEKKRVNNKIKIKNMISQSEFEDAHKILEQDAKLNLELESALEESVKYLTDLGGNKAASAKITVSPNDDSILDPYHAKLNVKIKNTGFYLNLAKWCIENNLQSEASECLRAELVIHPDNKEANDLYKNITPPHSKRTLVPISPKAIVQETIYDGYMKYRVGKKHKLVILPVKILDVEKQMNISRKTIKGKAGGRTVSYLGVYHAPGKGNVLQRLTEKDNLILGRLSGQIWEEVKVEGSNKSDVKDLFLQNTLKTQKSLVGNEWNEKKDSSSQVDKYNGPLILVFKIRNDEELTSIKYKNENSFEFQDTYNLKQFKKTALDDNALIEDRIKSMRWLFIKSQGTDSHILINNKILSKDMFNKKFIESMTLSKSIPEVLDDLIVEYNEVYSLIKSDNSEFVKMIKSKIENYNNECGLIPVSLFVQSDSESSVYIDNDNELKTNILSVKNHADEFQLVSEKNNNLKIIMNLSSPGDILFRIRVFDINDARKLIKDRYRIGAISTPGIYSWDLSVLDKGDPILAELWHENRLIGVQLLNVNRHNRTILRNQPIIYFPQRVNKTREYLHAIQTWDKTGFRRSNLFAGKYDSGFDVNIIKNILSLKPPDFITHVNTQLNSTQNQLLKYLITTLSHESLLKIEDILELVKRLESEKKTPIAAVENEIIELLGSDSTGMFRVIAESASPEVSKRIVSKVLTKLALTTPEACRELLEMLVHADSNIRRTSKESLKLLMAADIIEVEKEDHDQRGHLKNEKIQDNFPTVKVVFKYHGQTYP